MSGWLPSHGWADYVTHRGHRIYRHDCPTCHVRRFFARTSGINEKVETLDHSRTFLSDGPAASDRPNVGAPKALDIARTRGPVDNAAHVKSNFSSKVHRLLGQRPVPNTFPGCLPSQGRVWTWGRNNRRLPFEDRPARKKSPATNFQVDPERSSIDSLKL